MKKIQWGAVGLMSWFVVMALLHYFAQRPLGNDEYWVFTNIHELPLGQMFQQGLIHDQEFPRIYLWSIGHLSHLFSDHLLAVRLLPFLSMMMAFFIWCNLAQKQISSATGFLTFLLCWCASAPLIYYAAELKQYSIDVLVAGIFLLFLYHQKDFEQKLSSWMFGLILIGLASLGLWSYAAFFFMLLPLYNLGMDAKDNRRGWGGGIVYLLACAGCLWCVYYYDFRLSDSSRMVEYWKDYMISFDSTGEFFRSLGEGFNNLISRWFALKPQWIRGAARFFIGLGLLGLLIQTWSLFKRAGFRFRGIGSVAGIVLLECILLSAFKKIPFVVPRIYLFFVPILFFFTVETIQWIRKRNVPLYTVIQYSFMAYLLLVAFGVAGLVFKASLGPEPTLWR